VVILLGGLGHGVLLLCARGSARNRADPVSRSLPLGGKSTSDAGTNEAAWRGAGVTCGPVGVGVMG
jgi:hypothetical protein